uniref:Predicted protein n=1 Tax=Hordeum vulgare subsp. vulgare TaxID=112509 RepID=F2EDC4_HORVV|nr:predicted protein [Hordeum vulgare subsp. vulgare]
MPVLPTLAAPLLRPHPRLPPPPPTAFSSSWSCQTKGRLLHPGLFATGADVPGCGGTLPEPEQRVPLLLAALRAARLREEESRRSDPLFIDPYAAVLLSLDVAHQASESLVSPLMPSADHYRLTTRYLDEKLQHLISRSDNFRQMEWTLVHIGLAGQGCLSCTMYHLEESSVQQPSNSEEQEQKYRGTVFCFILL